VDLFKAYNDTYGHQHGDSCLKQIAEACMDVVSRPGDLVARFGGEEFVVALPNTESEGAVQVANEICESLRNRRLPHTGSPFGFVTISIGCATLVPQANMHAPDLISMADNALYTAKHNGRNQVCLSSTVE
jgi:diguanylate cyclase (GGDEF)-like protein